MGKRQSPDDKQAAKIFAAFAKERPDFFEYPENHEHSKCEPKKLMQIQALIQKLFEFYPALAWSQSAMMTILQLVHDEVSKGWPRLLDPTELTDWKERMARRFRTGFRHISKARGNNPAWLRELLGYDDPDGEEEDGDMEEGEEEDDMEEDEEE